jgi:CopG family transcriptional regulator, nickel-responsive regulator
MADLERFTVSMDKQLLEKFDLRSKERGYANRSEAVRDLVRGCLVEEDWKNKTEKMAATVTLVYDHHKREVMEKITELQHHSGKLVVAATHVHLDNDNCLEVIILRGPGKDLKNLSDKLISLQGVKHGQTVYTTEGKNLT